MRAQHVVLAALGAAVALASGAAAGPDAAKQRVAITSKGVVSPGALGTFVFTPLQAGALERDSGTESSTFTKRYLVRDGQDIQVEEGVTTSEGKLGSFVVRYRGEFVDAGNGYHAGTGTWKFLRGTGQYAGITGGGRIGSVFLGTRWWRSRSEGFLTAP